jgi:23S rRNA pseudouridine1911/1915/1917 synthase
MDDDVEDDDGENDDCEDGDSEDGAAVAASPAAGPISLAVAEGDVGTRLDRFLASRLASLSRARLQALIREGAVEGLAGAATDPGLKVRLGQRFTVTIPPAAPPTPAAELIKLEIVYEDKHLIVVDKPAGLVVHPAAGHASGTLVNALIAHCGAELSGIGGVKRPGIVHRLDKDTSGLLVVAKTDAAHKGLSEQFAAHGRDGRLERTYLALVWGVPHRERGAIEANVGRSTKNRTRMAVVKGEAGRHAVTHYEVQETFESADGKTIASLLRLKLETGRTHQIRVHLAHVGHPVLGDPVYGTGFKASSAKLSEAAQGALVALGRQALHAAELGFVHPVTEKTLSFKSRLPPDLQILCENLRRHTSAAMQPPARRKAKPKLSKR